MNRRWQRFAIRFLVWLAAEIVFNLFGLDDLADASEFIFRHREPAGGSQLAYVQVFEVDVELQAVLGSPFFYGAKKA
ncbi:MAG: hypothetical protein AAFY57_03895 [Cyanobacteria bacterium J06642_2]